MTITFPNNAMPPADWDPSGSHETDPSTGDAVIVIPGFETADTLDRFGGDVALYHSILELLIPTLTEALERFDASQASHDNAALKGDVHAIRGMAANVGAIELAASAGALESTLRDGVADDELVMRFRSLVTATIDAIEQGLRP